MQLKTLIIGAAILLFAIRGQSVHAQATDTFPHCKVFSRDLVYNIQQEGAVGDGKTLNTDIIQQVLDKANGKGAQVVIPKGVYLCGPLQLYGNTNLVLEKGAVLRLDDNIAGFPVADNKYLNFITVNAATDVKISGEGTIDGQGAIWWEKFKAKEITARRPQMVYIANTIGVEIEGITFLNPPNTHLSLKNTRRVYIHGIKIQAPADSKNTDGINISAKDCLIENCNINTGDDNIAINFGNSRKPGEEAECSNITVRNCFFGYGHGLSVGSYTSGGLDRLSVSHCRFDGTTAAIRIKTARGRGGIVENLNYSDLEISNCKWPIFISEYYPKEPEHPGDDNGDVTATSKIPVYRNILLNNIKITGAGDAIKIWGLPESPVNEIRFNNVHIQAIYGAQLYNVKGAVFENCSVSNQKGEKLKSYNAEIVGWK